MKAILTFEFENTDARTLEKLKQFSIEAPDVEIFFLTDKKGFKYE